MAGPFDRPMAIGQPDEPFDSGAPGGDPDVEPEALPGGGFNLTPAMAILMGSAASSLISGIMNQRNLREGREFQSDEAAKGRAFNREETRRGNILGSISGMGNRATQSAEAQSSALSRLAQLFGGV